METMLTSRGLLFLSFLNSDLLDPKITDCAKLRPLCASFTDVFLDAIAKAKKLIRESIAQNLMPVSLTKVIYSYQTQTNLT